MFNLESPPVEGAFDGSLEPYGDLGEDRNRWIVVGPWISEVGYELLYWIPFVRWMIQSLALNKSRIIILSRGGTAPWYADLSKRYVEIFDLITLEEFKKLNAQRTEMNKGSSQKQLGLSPLDHEILKRALNAIGKNRAAVIHPVLLYRHFERFWLGEEGWNIYDRSTDLRPFVEKKFSLSPDMMAFINQLPERFIAIKFYARPTLPADDGNKRLVRDIAKRVAGRKPVVSLNFGLEVDDHRDFDLSSVPDVIHLPRALSPSENLLVQSAVVARSDGLVGTYGGFSYLPMMYKRPSVGLYLPSRGHLANHFTIVGRVGRRLNATCSMVDARAYLALL